MYEIDEINEIDENQYHPKAGNSLFGWLLSPACILLSIFMFGTTIFTGKGQQQVIGALLVLVSFTGITFRSLRILFPIPPEIKMYAAWVIWAGVTGPLVAINMESYWLGGIRNVLQILVLIIAVYGIIRIHGDRALKAVMFGLIAGGVLQALVTKSAVQAYGGNIEGIEATADRAMGLTTNPNSLGFLMIWAMLAACMLWRQKRGKTHIIIQAGTFLLFPILCYGMLASGSRKALVVFTFVLGAWLWYAMAPRKRAKAAAWKMGLVVAFIIISGPVSVYLMNHTPAGKRMEEKLFGGGGIIEAEEGRYIMYIEGIRMTLRNPVCGVGINQYKYHSSSGKYSHSNYIEPLATTGILGFILYQGIFFIPLFRAWRVTKIIDNETQIYQLKLIIVGCAAILLLGFGVPWYTNTTVLALLALISGYTHNCLQQACYEQQSYLEESEYV